MTWKFVYNEGHSLPMNETWFIAFTKYKDVPGIFDSILYVNREGLQNCTVPEEELERVREEGKKFFNRQFREAFAKRIKTAAEEFRLFYEEYQKIDVEKLSNDEIWLIYAELYKRLEEFCALFQVSGGRSYPVIEEHVKAELGKHFKGKKLEEKYAEILTSPEPDLLQQEEEALFQLQNPGDEELIAHSEEYALHYSNTYDENEVIAFLKERLEKGSPAHERSVQQEETLNMLDPEARELALYLQEQGCLRFKYKDVWGGAEWRFRKLLEEIAARIGIPLKQFLLGYRIGDTEAFLLKEKNVDIEEIKKRMSLFIFLKEKGKETFASGDEAERVVAKILPKKESAQELKGIPASPGFAKGKACVVRCMGIDELQADLHRFKTGDILVTTMTQPNMVVLMKKAAAIVTNQGGITSHAAVISRELGIPCIINTKKATRAFKNGDFIEVDANTGMVKKL